jgi:hypothetical protein
MGLVVACRMAHRPLSGVFDRPPQRLTHCQHSQHDISMVTLTAVGAVAVLALVSSTVQAFFAWQATVGLLYAWRCDGPMARDRRRAGARFSLSESDTVWRLFRRHDRVSRSPQSSDAVGQGPSSANCCPLNVFGHYALASLLASALYIILTPTIQCHLPEGSARWWRKETKPKSHGCFRNGVHACWRSVLFPLAGVVTCLFAHELVLVWTGNADMARDSRRSRCTLFIIGSAFKWRHAFPVRLASWSHGERRSLPHCSSTGSCCCVVGFPLVLTPHDPFWRRWGVCPPRGAIRQTPFYLVIRGPG